MNQAVREIAGLRTLVVGDRAAPAALVLVRPVEFTVGTGTAEELIGIAAARLKVPAVIPVA